MAAEIQGNGSGRAGAALVQLERQVERGSLFTHTALSNNAERLHEAESFLYGLIDVLVALGVTTSDEVAEAAGRVRREMAEKGETLGPGVALRVEETRAPAEFVPVNCNERIHICKAICCKLNFTLTANEIESGQVKWDLGRPYYIRQEASGYCTHNDTKKGCCSIYHNRPGVCRNYSCANDKRIWKDFEKMELNEEWLAENLAGESKPRLARALMLRPEEIDPEAIEPDALNTLNEKVSR